ncbi:MAG: hypothetical protein J6Y72_07045 [Bacteroidales bacterium]|nr:hypothetical protein [Bacteroidales bacterium]
MANENKIFDFGEKLGDSVKDRNFGVRTAPPRQPQSDDDSSQETPTPRYSLELCCYDANIWAMLKGRNQTVRDLIIMRTGEEIFRETGKRNYAHHYLEEHREALQRELESYDVLRYNYPIQFIPYYATILYKVIGKAKEGVVKANDFHDYCSLVGSPYQRSREARAFEYIHTHYTQLRDMVATNIGLDFTDKAGLFATIRNAPTWRENGRNATEQDFLDVFGFRAVEFGETMPQKERWQHMNRAYDSFMDLANVLGFSPSSIAMGGRLAICFGSRGHGGRAAAHYEPGRNIINLTRKNGAGCLAHEWFHALDYCLGGGDAATSKPRQCQNWSTMTAIDSLVKTLTNSQMANDSRVLGGYWKDAKEMAARAFEAYVQDKLRGQGWENEYLVQLPEVKTQIHPYPHGTERETFNACLHSLFSNFTEVAGLIKNTELQ